VDVAKFPNQGLQAFVESTGQHEVLRYPIKQ